MDITAPRFVNETAAREHLEGLRWPTGPFCPHCGSFAAKRLPAVRGRPTKAHPEGAIREGVIQCNDCRQQYSVTVGTVFESSKIALHKWVLATYLLSSSKKGMSAHQLHRMLGVTYKTAWFMAHRIREAMTSNDDTPMGSGGGTVEVDETFIGRDRSKAKKATGYEHKMKVLSLIDRATGRSTSVVVENVTMATLTPIITAKVSAEAHLLTDDAGQYRRMGEHFVSHNVTRHTKGSYVDSENAKIHTNTVEGFFSVFKRGMIGTYQHCAKGHLHRYLAEFDFRYTNRKAVGVDDATRADIALKGISGKRLMYRRPVLVA
jgi:transposase-like protein